MKIIKVRMTIPESLRKLAKNIKGDTSVCNIQETGENKCTCCGSWIKHWENNGGGQSNPKCSVIGCGEAGVHGAHVEEVGVKDKVYIIPLCEVHNHPDNKKEMDCPDDIVLVSARENSSKCKRAI